MPLYRNNRRDDVHLVGPGGVIVVLKAGATLELDSYFDRYINTGLIRREEPRHVHDIKLDRMKLVQKVRTVYSKQDKPESSTISTTVHHRGPIHSPRHQIVGQRIHEDALPILQKNLQDGGYPISNGTGIGILSYNRGRSLKRLIESIQQWKHSGNGGSVTIFVSDDSSTEPTTLAYLTDLARSNDFIVLRNYSRLGVAGNSNKLLFCLSRFRNFLLLNDDVEILANGWQQLYVDASRLSGIQHFIYNQPGVYGARDCKPNMLNGVLICTVYEKPHGAILFATRNYLDTVGYFDESYGYYGLEHVDWSTKAFESGLQPFGYHDLTNSNIFFKIHAEPSAIPDRVKLLNEAKLIHTNRKTGRHCKPSTNIIIPSVSYVIPIRNTERSDAIVTIINNIRSQRFPNIEIIVVEQDEGPKIDINSLGPIIYLRIGGSEEFNKSLAFNVGVQAVTTDYIILHDADILVPSWYTQKIYETLQSYDACHIGGKVIYADHDSSKNIETSSNIAIENTHIDRIVGYFEGGSICCKTEIFWSVGGFNEVFSGYGCEDTDYFYRLSKGCNFLNNRYVDFLHLWHSRVPGWEAAHTKNKLLEAELRKLPINEYIATLSAKNKLKYNIK